MARSGNGRAGTLQAVPMLFALLAAACAARSDVDRLDRSVGGLGKRVETIDVSLRQAQEANANLGAELGAMREQVQVLSGQLDELLRQRPGLARAAAGEDVLPALTKLQNDVWDLKVRLGIAAGPPPAGGAGAEPAPSVRAPETAAGQPPAEGLPPAALPRAETAAPAPSPSPGFPPVTYVPPPVGVSPLVTVPAPLVAAEPPPAVPPAYPSPAAAIPSPAPGGIPAVASPVPGAVVPPPTTPPVLPPGLPSPAHPSADKALLDEAQRLFEKKLWQASRDKFADLIKKFPSSDLADNAHYGIGETYFAEGKYEPAFLEFEMVVKNYKASDKACDALLKQALSYKSLNYHVDARLAFQKVAKQCAGTPAAERAKKELQQAPAGR